MFTAPHRDPNRPSTSAGGVGRRKRSRARRSPAALLALWGTALLIAAVAVVPVIDPATAAAAREARADTAEHAGAQQLQLATESVAAIAPRDEYSAELSPGRMAQQLIGDGTQADWARLVLYDGGWPITDQKVLAITQWMRAENSPTSWWLRDNPLNNGFGTFAGTFMSGYPDLVAAAQQCAAAIQKMGGYQVIEDALAADSSRDQVRAAIIASSWATGHYGGGAHWGDATPPEVAAPASAWGR